MIVLFINYLGVGRFKKLDCYCFQTNMNMTKKLVIIMTKTGIEKRF